MRNRNYEGTMDRGPRFGNRKEWNMTDKWIKWMNDEDEVKEDKGDKRNKGDKKKKIYQIDEQWKLLKSEIDWIIEGVFVKYDLLKDLFMNDENYLTFLGLLSPEK